MGIVELSKTPASKITTALGGGLTDQAGPLSWLKQANEFVNTLNTLMNTINKNPLIGAVTGQAEVIKSNPNVKTMKNITPQTPVADPMSEENLTRFFSTPEGLRKIAEAIDGITPIIGDCKLSELKKEIHKLAGAPDNKTQDPGKSKGGKKKDGSRPKK